MSEPNAATEPDSECDQPRPFQFTIGSLMILTAAVAVFFAIATQVGLVYAAVYLHFALTVLALKYQRGWKSITAINFLVFIVVATQLPFFVVAGYFHIVLLIIAFSHPTQTTGIMCINYAIFNSYLGPAIMFTIGGGWAGLALSLFFVPTNILVSLICSTLLIFSSNDSNRIYGYIGVVISFLIIVWYVILWN